MRPCAKRKLQDLSSSLEMIELKITGWWNSFTSHSAVPAVKFGGMAHSLGSRVPQWGCVLAPTSLAVVRIAQSWPRARCATPGRCRAGCPSVRMGGAGLSVCPSGWGVQGCLSGRAALCPAVPLHQLKCWVSQEWRTEQRVKRTSTLLTCWSWMISWVSECRWFLFALSSRLPLNQFWTAGEFRVLYVGSEYLVC